MKRRRRIGLVLMLMGVVPLLVFIVAYATSRLTGGGIMIAKDDLRTYGLHAERVGFAETTPLSTVSVQFKVNLRTAWPKRRWSLPCYVRRDFELSADLDRADTKVRRRLTDSELNGMLRQHGPLIATSLIGMIWVPANDVPPVISEMASAGETRRSVAQIVWRNIPPTFVEWLGGWWKWSLWAIMAIFGGRLWWRNRNVPLGHCLWCRYDMRGISQGAPCPECGQTSESLALSVNALEKPSK